MITLTLPWWAASIFILLFILLAYVDSKRAKAYQELMEDISEMWDNMRIEKR